MKKLVLGGQLAKSDVEKIITGLADGILDISVKSDLEAAMSVQNCQADYYVGACETGSGGALAMAIALLGSDQCVTLASPSKIMSAQEIKNEVASGKKAFGFTANAAANVLETLIPEIIDA